ncbi:Netrin-A [Gryllus bimaculatus]|nr:Netrin-A [Gryllus bimaculatus]
MPLPRLQRMGAWSKWRGATCFVVSWLCLISLANCQIIHEDDPVSSHYDSGASTKCYDDSGRPQRCIPPFENAAFNVLVEATNTCGENGPTQYCVQTGTSGTQKSCQMCYDANTHHAAYLTDFNKNENQTWWQSETMYQNVQYPSQVNLTLHLRKAFDITYVRLWFYSPRPESFAIYKRTTQDGPWIPYQFYSATCRDTYGLPDSSYTRKGSEEARALCTAEYSDISPLTGGNVAFSTLEGRPSAYFFENSPELQYLEIHKFCSPISMRSLILLLEQACNCNSFSTRCYFDKHLYETTGHGGHCLDCTGNRDGPNCERCKENYYQREDNYCVACNCNEIGSRNLQCNSEGRCQCKPGVVGDKCDRCDTNYYDFSSLGCKPCQCNKAGSYGNVPNCDPITGSCHCKENVEGKRCGNCKPGYFNLDEDNDFGCTPCFCYGHASLCSSAPGYSRVYIESIFARGTERWKSQDYHGKDVPLAFNSVTQVIGVKAPYKHPIYFVAPDVFLGDQRASYNQDFTFKLRIGEAGPVASVEDVVLEGAGLSITQAIFGQGNRLPSVQPQEYKFRLHESSQYGWQPRLSARDFMSVLANLTAIRIRGTYASEGVGFLDNVKLATARRGAPGRPAHWIENCNCPQGYVGQFCESCAPGYRHEPSNGGPFAPCVRCNCNGHADICDAETGRCICQHNTAGDNCDRCAKGYYGNALHGTEYDCLQCPCPYGGPCFQMDDEFIFCSECPTGYGGPRCDTCSDGYFGDPSALTGYVVPCQLCKCNDNIDLNAVGNCNRTTGECLKCIYNTGGPHCERCMPGFYGDALALPKGDCKQCQCYPVGTVETGSIPLVCDQVTGQCQCKPHVIGKNCDQCEEGYFDIISGEGCQPCNCDPIGSLNHSCDVHTGQCQCRPGITGLHCDSCEQYRYGFSAEGCKACECDTIGSESLQCDPQGQCPCLENVEGRQCDRCKENKYDRHSGCHDCPECYNLVQDAVNAHREKLKDLRDLLNKISSSPVVLNDEEFDRKIVEVEAIVNELWNNAKEGTGSGDKSLLEHLTELSKRLVNVENLLRQVDAATEQALIANALSEANVTQAEEVVERAQELLKDALDYLVTDGYAGLEKAQERSKQFGQQSEQMSEIAREARVLAEKQEEEAKGIQELAQRALNKSIAAYELAREALDLKSNLSNEIRSLRSDMDAAGNTQSSLKAIVEDTKNQVDTTHANSANTSLFVSRLTVPEAAQIKSDAEKLLQEFESEKRNLSEQLLQADELLQAAIQQQQRLDELLADADAANDKASEAVRLGDKTLKEAQETLETLQEFDNQVQESKGQAEEALRLVPEIEELINEANEKTNGARRALEGAQLTAKNARDIAVKAQSVFAEQASQEADQIRRRANDTKLEAVRLSDKADELAANVALTADQMQSLEEQAKEDEELTAQARQKVGQAKSNTAEATWQVKYALDEVNFIMQELEDMKEIDVATLDDLERRLEDVEMEYKDANIDFHMSSLSSERNAQNQHIKNYEEELYKLQLEVDNVREISESLPDNCWKRLKLEP